MKYTLLILALFLLLIIGINVKKGEDSVSENINTLPSFELETLNKGKLSLSSLKNKVVLINFWATWCPPCREEMPYFEKIYSEYKDKGLVIIALSLDAREDFVRDFIKDFGVTFPVAMADNELANSYGVSALPVSFLYDKEGKLVKRKIGAYMTLEEDIKKLLSID